MSVGPRRFRTVDLLLSVLALIGAGSLVGVSLLDRDPLLLRAEMTHLHYWFLEAGFVLCCALWLWNLPQLLQRLNARLLDMQLLLGIALLASVLVTTVAPRTSRVYYDEQIYLNIGQNLCDLKKAQVCNEGTVEYGALQCNRGEYNKQPYAYPYMLSWVFRLFGTSADAAFRFNNLCLLVFVLAVWATTLLLFNNRPAALLASLIAALTPETLRWFATAASEPSAATASTVALLGTVYFCRAPSWRSVCLMVSVTSLAAQFRPESIICIPLMLVTILLLAPGELLKPRLYVAGGLGLALTLNLLGHLAAVRFEAWGAAGGPRFGSLYFLNNLAVNGTFYFANERIPGLYAILAILGVVLHRHRAILVPLLYFLSFWGVFLFFYAGSYEYGADVRYSLLSNGPLAILGGCGAGGLVRFFETKVGRWRAGAMAASLVILTFLWFMPLVRSVGEEAWAARTDVSFAEDFAALVPADGIVLSHNPSMFLVAGVNSAQAVFAVGEQGFLDHLRRRYHGGIYFHWNFWCNVDDAGQAGICRTILERNPHRILEERKRRDFRYALYEIGDEGESEGWQGAASGGDRGRRVNDARVSGERHQ